MTLVFSVVSFDVSAAAQKPAKSRAPAREEATLTNLSAILEKAIAGDEIPGAVLLVEHRGRIVHRRAYGSRAVLPTRERMTVDTVFDLASLTKVVATASAVMKLVEWGKVRLNDPVARYIPEFAPAGGADATRSAKGEVTVRHLLTHMGGLPAIPRVAADARGDEPVLKSIYDTELVSPPGARFVYSDAGFILLGELVRRVSSTPLDEFVARSVFVPLGMRHTSFRLPKEWLARIAPTEEIDLPEGAKAGSGRGHLLRGVVHDPRARAMGGVAGHAGLFSTADDLAAFCGMLLSGGRAQDGRRIFAAATVSTMTTPQTPPWSPTRRGFGWDIDSIYSAPRGELFPIGSFGHTGFTGTSVWIDPSSQTFIILLTSSLHPYPRPRISSLRARIATAVAAQLNLGDGREFTSLIERSAGLLREPARNARTQTGLDVLAEANFSVLRGKRVGLITNHTGIDRAGRSAVELLARAEGVKLLALFSPEHGFTGHVDEKIASSSDPASGLPVHSLYGETLRPTERMLRGIDALVFDIQDAGVRFYTYKTTMAYAMEEAAKRNIPVYVLDRPNPLGGEVIEGPMLDPDRRDFEHYFPMPVRHGMTMGELALMFNAENNIRCELHVVRMKDWRRSDRFEATGLLWIPPSPNLRSLDAALLYPGIEILRAAGISVGRGTDTPFELFGAPWIRATELAEYLNRRFVPGVRFVPTRFTPRADLHANVPCEGAGLVITDRASLHSILMGLEIAAALAKLYPEEFGSAQLDKMVRLVGSRATIERLKKGDAPTTIVADWAEGIAAFKKMRTKYLLYE